MDEKQTVKARYVIVDSALQWNHRLLIIEGPIDEWVSTFGKRVLCAFGTELKLSSVLMDDGDGGYYLKLNKSLLKSLALKEGEELLLTIEVDVSTYGTEVSEAFLQVLKADEDAAAHFELLTPGKKRSLIHWVDQVKSESIKIRRALILMDHLKIEKGKVDFKLLNAMMKQSNERQR